MSAVYRWHTGAAPSNTAPAVGCADPSVFRCCGGPQEIAVHGGDSLLVDYTMYSHGNLLDDNSSPCSIPMQSPSRCAAALCRDTYRQICARRSWDDLRLHIRNWSGTRRVFRIKCRLPRLVHIENTDRRSSSLTPNFDSAPLQRLRHEAAPVSLHTSRGILHCTGRTRATSCQIWASRARS